jgi:chaperone required for assembly of F1-ATPase
VKRFWTDVALVTAKGGWAIQLDERPVKTPARAPLLLPSATLAEAIADEWRQVGEKIDPRAMPLTGLANAAIDRVAPDRQAFAVDLARYAEADLTCYRAEGPRALVERQSEAWDPLLGWARRRFDIDFVTTGGLMHVAQPAATVERLTHAVALLDSFKLAALAPLVTIGGSLVAALAAGAMGRGLGSRVGDEQSRAGLPGSGTVPGVVGLKHLCAARAREDCQSPAPISRVTKP